MATIDRSNYHYLPTGTVTFDVVLVDVGNNFNIANGEFVVPRRGNYLFMIDGTLGQGSNSAMLNLMVNGETINTFSKRKDPYYHNPIIGIFSFPLHVGDVVTLENHYSNSVYVNMHYPFRFMGVWMAEL